MLTVTDLKQKRLAMQKKDTVEEYVDNFSHVADYFDVKTKSGGKNSAFDFGKLFQKSTETNLMKKKINGGIK